MPNAIAPKRAWLIVCCTAAILLTGVDAPAHAAKYKCTVVDDISRLGVHDRSTVTIESATDDDDDGKFCAFSVNGWPTRSPRPELLREAMRMISTGAPAALVDNQDAFLALMMSAGSARDPSSELRQIFERSASSLRNCIQSIGRQAGREFVDDDRLRCVSHSPGRHQDLSLVSDGRSRGIEYTLGVPAVVIRVVADRKVRWLFLPQRR